MEIRVTRRGESSHMITDFEPTLLRVNNENNPNVITPQRVHSDYINAVSPLHPVSYGKSALLTGAKRIIAHNPKTVDEPKRGQVPDLTPKKEKNHFMKPTEAYQHAREEASLTPIRLLKKSSHSFRTPSVSVTPSTTQKAFKKTKPSVVTPSTPASEEKVSNNPSKPSPRPLVRREETAVVMPQDPQLLTPIREKTPRRGNNKQRSVSTPPARPSSSSQATVSSQSHHAVTRTTRPREAGSVRSAPSYMEPTTASLSAKKVSKHVTTTTSSRERDSDPVVVAPSQTILFSPQSLLRRSTSASRLLDDLVLQSESTHPQESTHNHHHSERPVSAPKPRPSPFSYALHTEETKETARLELLRTPSSVAPPPPATVAVANHPVTAVVTPEEPTLPATPSHHHPRVASKPAKKTATTPSSGGFTAEQLSAYKARKRAIMAVGSTQIQTQSQSVSHSTPNKAAAVVAARYAAPTLSAFIRAKEQSNKKAIFTPSPSAMNKLGSPRVTSNNEEISNRYSSPSRRLMSQMTSSPAITTHNNREGSPRRLSGNRVGGEIDANQLLSLMDAVEHPLPEPPPQKTTNTMTTTTTSANAMPPPAPSTATTTGYEAMFDPSNNSNSNSSYNESSNILNMTIEDSTAIMNMNLSDNNKIRQKSFDSEISSVKGGGATVYPLTASNLLDDVSFQASIDLLTVHHHQPDYPNNTTNTSRPVVTSDMNRMLEDSMKLLAENKRVIQTVQDRMSQAHPTITTTTSNTANTNTHNTASGMGLESVNLSAIDPIDSSPHSFSMGSISTLGELSAYRRTFSPVSELLRKPTVPAAATTATTVTTTTTAGLSITIHNNPPPAGPVPRKRSVSTEPPTPRLGPELLNISMISRSNSIHCLPTPTNNNTTPSNSNNNNNTNSSNHGRSETPLLVFEKPLVPVKEEWTTEILHMVQESTRTINNNNNNNGRSKPVNGETVMTMERSTTPSFVMTPSKQQRKDSLTDQEVDGININNNTTTSSSSLAMDSSTYQLLNTAMIRSTSSMGLVSNGPSTLTIPTNEEMMLRFSPPPMIMTPTHATMMTISEEVPTVSEAPPRLAPPTTIMTTTANNNRNNDTSSSNVMMISSSLTNPISQITVSPLGAPNSHLPVESDHYTINKENLSPTGEIMTSSGHRSPFFFADSTQRRTPLMPIISEEKQATIVKTGDCEDSRDQAFIAEDSEAPFMITTDSSSSHHNNTNTNSSHSNNNSNTSNSGLNEGFLQETISNSRSAFGYSNASSQMITSPRETSTTSTTLLLSSTISPEKPAVSTMMEIEEEEVDQKNQPPPAAAVSSGLLPKQLNSSFELEPRRLSVLPVPAIVTSNHLPVYSHHVKAVGYESIEKTPLRSISSTGSSRSLTRKSSPLMIIDHEIQSLPSVPIPLIQPSERHYFEEEEEEETRSRSMANRSERIENHEDMVNLSDNEEEEEEEEEEEAYDDSDKHEKEEVVVPVVVVRSRRNTLQEEDNHTACSSIIEMNESLHSLTAFENNKSFEFLATTLSLDRSLTNGQQLTELLQSLCEAERALTTSEAQSRQTLKDNHQQKEEEDKAGKTATSVVVVSHPPVSISSMGSNNSLKPVVEMSLSEDRSSSSYTSSVEELAGYEGNPLLFLPPRQQPVEGLLSPHMKRSSQPPLPPSISMMPVSEVDEKLSTLMDLITEEEDVRYYTHREEMNPALTPSPRATRLSTLISPDPVASQLMLNNRRHVNERNIKMMEQTFMTVNDLNNSR